MQKLILIVALFVLAGCANTQKGQWQATKTASSTPKQADSFCWKLSQHEPYGFQEIRYNQCMESKGLVYARDSNEVKECKSQCKTEFSSISVMEKQFVCLDRCESSKK